VIVYAESSAVLAWILGEPAESAVRRVMNDAERVVSSALTILECGRALARGAALGRLRPTDELAAQRLLDTAAAGWYIFQVSDDVLTRARARFPVEPVRTLDALHLATATTFRDALGSLSVLSLDERIRTNAAQLGRPVLPG
jgi:predicted nucleic acid-binding protein